MRAAIRLAKAILSTYLLIGNIAGARAEGLSFKGQTITLEVGAPPAGALDPYARLLAPSLGVHLPGQPSVVVSNVPGAASVTLARQLYNDAPKDGSVIGVLFSNALVGPLFGETQMTGYDPKKFIYLGSAHSEGSVCAVRKDAGVKSVNDLLNHRILIGATSIASPNYQFAKISNAILGTKFKLILGYQGVAAIRLAMERKEVQGICTGWSAIKTNFPGILTGKSFAQVVAQGDVGSVPELSAIGVPALISLAKNERDRQSMRFFLAQNLFGVPFVISPGVTDVKVKLLRAAFVAAMNDRSVAVQAEKLHIPLNLMSGDDVQEEMSKLYETPRAIIDSVRRALAVSD